MRERERDSDTERDIERERERNILCDRIRHCSREDSQLLSIRFAQKNLLATALDKICAKEFACDCSLLN